MTTLPGSGKLYPPNLLWQTSLGVSKTVTDVVSQYTILTFDYPTYLDSSSKGFDLVFYLYGRADSENYGWPNDFWRQIRSYATLKLEHARLQSKPNLSRALKWTSLQTMLFTTTGQTSRTPQTGAITLESLTTVKNTIRFT